MTKHLLTTQEAANYLGVSKQFLERDRYVGARIPYIQVGARAIRYRLQDLNEYLDSQLKTSTAEV